MARLLLTLSGSPVAHFARLACCLLYMAHLLLTLSGSPVANLAWLACCSLYMARLLPTLHGSPVARNFAFLVHSTSCCRNPLHMQNMARTFDYPACHLVTGLSS